jgi:hypothetical protein
MTTALRTHDRCAHGAYEMTCEEFDLLTDRSGGRCEFCGIPEVEAPRQSLVIDHDHRYGFPAVRGLICDACMRRVDADERPAGGTERAYYESAWFVELTRLRRGASPLSRMPVDWDLWKAFGKVAPRRETLRLFIRWYVRKPGAKMPKRPAPPD